MDKQHKRKRCITSILCIMLCMIFMLHSTSINVYAEDIYIIQWDGTLSESLEYYGSTKYTSYVYRGKTENFDIGSFKKIVIPYTVIPQDGGCNQHVNEQYPGAPQGTIKDAATGETIDTFYGSWENTEGISQNVYIEVFAYCTYQYTEAKDKLGYYRWFWRMNIQNLQGTYAKKPTGASIPSSGRIQMSGTYSADTGQVRAGYNQFDRVPGQGWANSATTSTIPYDLRSVKKISYSGVNASTSYGGSEYYPSSYNNFSESRTMSFYEALNGEKIFEVTLINGSGEVDMEGYNQVYDLSNAIIKMNATASVYIGSGYAGKSAYVSGSSSLPQYIEVGETVPVVTTDIPANRNYNFQDELKLTITASGETPLSYQWYENDTAIAGATSPTLDLGVQEGLRYNGSQIYCEVTNNLGSATSQTCVLKANVGTFKPLISASSLTTLI